MDENKLNNELANFTDSLLTGGAEMDVSADNEALVEVVRQLKSLIADDPPSDMFKARMNQRLQQEWNMTVRSSNIQKIQHERFVRRLTIAAIFLLVMSGTFYILTSYSDGGSDPAVEGTASGDGTLGLLAAVTAIIGLALFFVYNRKSRG